MQLQRKAVWTFVLVLGIESLRWLFSSEAFWYFNAAGLWLAVIVFVPSVAFLRGAHWCRFVIGSVATILLLWWLMIPGMVHPGAGAYLFWTMWAVTTSTLVLTALTCFLISPKKEADPDRHRTTRGM